MAAYDALELHIISVEAELKRFITKASGYELGWVKVEGDRYVRYDRVASVEIKRGLDDDSAPMIAHSDTRGRVSRG